MGKKKQITVRRAEQGDIDALVRICRECFPASVKWQSGFFARKFWSSALRFPSSETWIWLVNDQAAGFSQIVIDEGAWAEEKRERGVGLAPLLLALVTHPRLIVLKIKKKIQLARHEDRRETQSGIRAEPGKRIWVERVAILPYYRKLGLALQIMNFSEERAMSLGRHAIRGVIEVINEPWCWLHERFGYVVTRSRPGLYTYTKILGSEKRVKESKGKDIEYTN
ncbi:MAG: GNAT family N-acetyltransferase [Candidatus Aenigmarchaeota archaeon]|nr:GNAT family N-acetyltransferase [Candidatus Aenigmarchaeota archaeon]